MTDVRTRRRTGNKPATSSSRLCARCQALPPRTERAKYCDGCAETVRFCRRKETDRDRSRHLDIEAFKELVLRYEADVENAQYDLDHARMMLSVAKSGIFPVLDRLHDVTPDHQTSCIWHLYWITKVPTDVIGNHLMALFPGRWANGYQVYKIAGPAFIDVVCGSCGKNNRVEIESRSALERVLDDETEHKIICNECVSKASRMHEVHLRNMPYAEYLQTQHWQNKRQDALERAAFRCQVCNAAKRLDVHHRTYERRGAEAPADLIVLCRGCHELFHQNGALQT